MKISCLLVLLSATLHQTSVSGQHNGQCAATFHVWRPTQDVLKTIRELDLRMDNVTYFTKFKIADMRSNFAEEVSKVRNWTDIIDKRISNMQRHQRDETAQERYPFGAYKVQKSEMEKTARRVDNLERSVDSIRSKLRISRSSYQHPHNIPQQQGISTDLGDVLKNSVSDLKSEWLLLKRDIETLKKGKKKQQKALDNIYNVTSHLKHSLHESTASREAVHILSSELSGKQAAMEKRLGHLEKETQLIIRSLTKIKELQSNNVDFTELLRQSKHRDLGSPDETNNMDEVVRPVTQTTSQHQYNSISQLPGNGGNHVVQKEAAVQGPETFAKDCQELYQAGYHVSSVYNIKPDLTKYYVPVYCEMINQTGYIVVQRRIDGSLDFNRRWTEYRQGFGNPYGELWAGNEFLHQLTRQKNYTLRFDLWDWEGGQFYAEYSTFRVDSERDNYRVHVGGYKGNAGDSFVYHNNMAFSTEDVDNDLHQRHCAAENKGGWWYNSCFYSQLNGNYHAAWYAQSQSNYADGVVWYTLKDNEFYSLRKTEMKLMPSKT